MEDEGIDGNDGGIVDTISNEQIAALFGVQEVLGCGASLEEYTTWYNSLGIVNIQPVDIDAMYDNYVLLCDAQGFYYIPPDQAMMDRPKDNNLLKIGGIVVGGYLLYSVLNTK